MRRSAPAALSPVRCIPAGLSCAPGIACLLAGWLASCDPESSAPGWAPWLYAALTEPDGWAHGAGPPGRWLLWGGATLILLALAEALRGRLPALKAPALGRRPGLVIGGACAVGLGWLGVRGFALAGKHATLFGREVWWLDDDMMITLRYARNLADGEGLVWNAAERVEGITNFLWALLLTPLHWVTDVDHTALGAILLAALLLGLVLVATIRWVRSMEGTTATAILAAVGVATCTPVVHWTSAGGEATMLALVLVLVATNDAMSPLRRGLLAGCAFAIRPDGMVVIAVLLTVDVLRRLRRGELTRATLTRLAAGVLAVPLLLTAFRWMYYGDPLPNTYYLKATGWEGKASVGWEYVRPVMIDYAPLWVLAVVAPLARARGAVAPLVALAAHTLYVVRIGGDELPEQRFFVPVMPLLFGLAAIGAERAIRRAFGRHEERAPVAVAVATVIVAGGLSHGAIPGAVPQRLAPRWQAEWGNVVIGKLIEANTAPEARVAHFWAGAAAYFSDRPGVDLLGKCDARIARQDARHGLKIPGHNKYDHAWSLGLEPDVLVGGFGGLAGDGYVAGFRESNPRYRAFADLYDEPAFQLLYRPQLVTLEELGDAEPWRASMADGGTQEIQPRMVSRSYHGIFVRQESLRVTPPTQWRRPPNRIQ